MIDKSPESHGLVGEVGRIDLFLSKRIAGVREMRGVSTELLASRLAMEVDTLKQYETGLKKIPAMALFRITQELNVTLGEIFGDEEPKEFSPTGPQ